MVLPQSVRIKIISTPDLIRSIKEDWSDDDEVELMPADTSSTGSMNFGLEEVAAIIAIVQGLSWLAGKAQELHEKLRKNGDQQATLIIRTWREAIIISPNDSLEDVQKKLDQIQ